MTTEELNNLKNKLSSGIAYPENVSYLGNKPNFTRDSFDTLEEMDAAIELKYIDEGHLSYCKSNGKTYKAIKTEEGGLAWSVFKPGGLGSGISVHTTATYDALEDDEEKPTDYIEIEDVSYQVNSRSQLDTLFSAIRSLQAEVARLKATFELGINSYTGSETAASSIMYDLDDVEEEEPLWAVQESELSELFTLQFNSQTELIPTEGCTMTPSSNGTYLTISGKSYWRPDENEIDFKELKDPKIFLYINTSEKNIKYVFYDEKNTYELSLSDLIPSYDATTYSTLLVISKQIKDKTSEELYGTSFIWITVQELINNDTIFEGYFDPLTLNTSNSTLRLNKNYYLDQIELTDLKVSKFDLYSKYQDFSDQVDAVRPSELETIKYRAAHITIRSVDTVEDLDRIINKLQTNELVYITSANSLYIISNGKRFKIGSSNTDEKPEPITENTMTVQELLENLSSSKIITLKDPVYDDESGNLVSVSSVELSKISSISLINGDSDDEIIYKVNSEGELTGRIQTKDKDTISYKLNPRDEEGNEVPLNSGLASFKNLLEEDAYSYRGFMANFLNNGNGNNTNDLKLKTDRIKIGSFYIPKSNDSVFGCSHCFVELENTSDVDFYLDGCYLHYAGPITGTRDNETNIKTATYHLALSGVIPAGGTYLIRGAKVADENLPTTYIKVNSYDIEWYVNKDTVTIEEDTFNYNSNYKKLLKFEYNTNTDSNNNIKYGFALTYGKSDLTYNIRLYDKTVGTGDKDVTIIKPKSYLIDSLNVISGFEWSTIKEGGTDKVTIINKSYSNSLYKNTFELDPAKQAFQSYSTKDSSRFRGANSADYQIVDLNKEYVQFPNSNDVMPVSVYTPKASYEHKNVCTDKTQVNTEKPNMVTVSFGINQLTTRCFNWISVGTYDEYVWVRQKGTPDWTRIQSYWNCDTDTGGNGEIYRKEFNERLTPSSNDYPGMTVRELVYANSKYNNVFPGCKINYTSHKCIINVNNDVDIVDPIEYEYVVGRSNSDGTPMVGHSSNIQYFTVYPSSFTPRIYQVTDQQGFHWIEYQAWAAAANKINEKILYDTTQSYVYTEATVTLDNFAKNRYFTSTNQNAGAATEFNNGTRYYTREKVGTYIYTAATVTSDNFVQNKYYTSTAQNAEPATEFNNGTTYYTRKRVGIMPILLNTGDMTQNGTRINEWLDYYQAGYCLFNHLEQMNVVGNNDLGNVDETALGTGDDPGKSNPHFYNICYCYEIPIVENNNGVYLPIFSGEFGLKYIPSMYYFDVQDNFRIIMVNSELTGTSGNKLFGSGFRDIYTGYIWSVVDDTKNYNTYDNYIDSNDARTNTYVSLSYTVSYGSNGKNCNHYLYEFLYQWFKASEESGKKVITACHEMPFTVITSDNIASSCAYSDRSISVAGSSTGLIGSHLNVVGFNKSGGTGLRSKGTYWFSRLLENFNVKYCIGGHKHTYACTWPIRENYRYKDGEIWKSSLTDGKMVMPASLENDTVNYYVNISNDNVITDIKLIPDTNATERGNIKNLTKFPITSSNNFVNEGGTIKIKGNYDGGGEGNSVLITEDERVDQNYVIYFMLQATGFKLKSNKELPGNLQKFSQIIPKTNASTPSTSQIYPMFAIIDLHNESYDKGLDFKLIAISNIVPHDTKAVFNQQTAYDSTANYPYGKPIGLLYFDNSTIPYGRTEDDGNDYVDKCWYKNGELSLKLNL